MSTIIYATSMKQMIVLIVTLMTISWLAAKKYYKFKSAQEQSGKTYNAVIGTTIAILFAQFVWAKIKKLRSGINWRNMPGIKRHGGPMQRAKDLFAAMKLEQCGSL